MADEADVPVEETDEPEISTEETLAEDTSTEESSGGIPGAAAASAIKDGKIDRTCNLPLTTSGETLSYWCTTNFGASSAVNSYNDHYGLLAAQEQTGVNLEFKECNMTVGAEQFSLMVASNDLTDIVVQFATYYTPGFDNAIEEDLVVDLNEYLDSAPIYKQMLDTDPALVSYLSTENGHLGAFYTILSDFAWVKESVAIRGDWLDELELEMPVTYDDYFEVLSAFKSEFDPTYCLNIGTNLGGAWFESGFGINVSSSGSSSISDLYVENKTVYSGFTSERFRDYLTMLHEWHDAGLISDDYVTIGDLEFFENDYAALIAAGEFGCVNGAGGLLDSYAAFSDDPDFRFDAGYLPRNNDDDTLCYLSPSSLINSDYCPSISTSCHNIELAMAFLDYFYTEEGSMLSAFGVEGESFVYDENGNPTLTEVITSAADTQGALMAYKVNLNSISDPNQNFRVTTTESAQAKMEFWTNDQAEIAAKGNNAYYPSEVNLTAEELEEASGLLADISTYVSEMVPGFIIGTKSMDEFDDYVAALEDMGIEDVVSIYQAGYDRYIG